VLAESQAIPSYRHEAEAGICAACGVGAVMLRLLSYHLNLMHEPDRGGAGFLTAAAFGGAYLAMHMVPGVLLALFGANPAGQRARLDHRPQDLLIGPCPARRERSGGAATVGAVEIEPYALAKPRRFILGDASIGAGRVCAQAKHACDQRLADATFDVRMSRIYFAGGLGPAGIESRNIVPFPGTH